MNLVSEFFFDSDIALKYSDISGLERSIDAAYQTASQRLFEVFIEKFKLLDHLRALKHYLMLGHGDFADQLMDTLGYGHYVYIPYIRPHLLVPGQVYPAQQTHYTAITSLQHSRRQSALQMPKMIPLTSFAVWTLACLNIPTEKSAGMFSPWSTRSMLQLTQFWILNR